MFKVLDSVLDYSKDSWGEDRIFLSETSVGVIDGSSPISVVPLCGYNSQAEWLANELSSSIKTNSHLSLPFICKQTTNQLQPVIPLNLEPKLKPCATFAGVQVIGDNLTTYVLGDCVILLEFKDGQIVKLTDSRITTFSNLTKQRKLEAERLGLDIKSVVSTQMSENRKMMNKQDGFFVVALDGAYETEFLTKSFLLKDLNSCLIFSDGFDRIFLNNLLSYADILNQDISLATATSLLRTWEESSQFAEVKKHDDVSVILLSFSC